MKVYETGVQKTSDIYFHTCSSLAKQLYFYLLCTGHYYCEQDYVVDRQNYNSFLILYVQSGSGYVVNDGNHLLMQPGTISLIDCYKPHKYYTQKQLELYWIHFDGCLARPYFEQITSRSIIFDPQNPYIAAQIFRKIFLTFHENKKINDAILSKYITDLLTELILCANSTVVVGERPSIIEDTIAFISENADQALTLEQLAKRVSLSPYYFTRIFKKETGFTPYEYIIHARVNLAKFYLKTTAFTVRDIAFRTGFNSESSFCTCFKKTIGVTPKSYRTSET